MVKKTLNEFILQSKNKHNDKYDYSKTKYIKSTLKVIIICPIHKEFEQEANSHLRGRGCPKCANNITFTNDDFIQNAMKIHNNKYDYSLVKYINNRTKIQIICPQHNIFMQIPDSHLRGRGCPKCGEIKFMSRTKTTKEFIMDANKIHNNTYDYSFVNYVNCKSYIKIICKKHGSFTQKPNTHLNARGCPKCNSSKGENEIRKILNNLNINFIEQYKFEKQPSHIKNCRYDFYIPDYNLIIEYHGIQHYIFSPFFHKTKEEMLKRRNRDYEKKLFCENNNIKFKEISYKDIIKIKLNLICDTFKLRETP